MKILSFLGLLLCAVYGSAATDRIVCYFNNAAVYRNGNGKFDVENINPTLCTHIIYQSLGINTNGNVKILDSIRDVTNLAFQRFVNLKRNSNGTKFMISLGGPNEFSGDFSKIAASSASRSILVNSVTTFIEQYKFDGLDLDWRYPVLNQGNPEDRDNFVYLLEDFRKRLGPKNMVFSIVVAPTSDYFWSAYNVIKMAPLVDFINVLSFDFHNFLDMKTGLNAPLYADPADRSKLAPLLSVNASMLAWINARMPASKINMGIPTFANTFTLASTSNYSVGARTIGQGRSGPYTLRSGLLSYGEVCERLNRDIYIIENSQSQRVPFAHNDAQWISYENIASVRAKIQFAKFLNLGGVMLYQIDMDDNQNICQNGPNSILQTVYTEIIGSNPTTTTTGPITTTASTSTTPRTTPTTSTTPRSTTTASTTPRSTTTASTTPRSTTTASTTTARPGYPANCSSSGFVRDPYNCTVFYRCNPGTVFNPNTALKYQCNNGFAFDTRTLSCAPENNVQC